MLRSPAFVLAAVFAGATASAQGLAPPGPCAEPFEAARGPVEEAVPDRRSDGGAGREPRTADGGALPLEGAPAADAPGGTSGAAPGTSFGSTAGTGTPLQPGAGPAGTTSGATSGTPGAGTATSQAGSVPGIPSGAPGPATSRPGAPAGAPAGSFLPPRIPGNTARIHFQPANVAAPPPSFAAGQPLVPRFSGPHPCDNPGSGCLGPIQPAPVVGGGAPSTAGGVRESPAGPGLPPGVRP